MWNGIAAILQLLVSVLVKHWNYSTYMFVPIINFNPERCKTGAQVQK